MLISYNFYFFFFQAEDGIRDYKVTGVQTCALPICLLELLADALPQVLRIAELVDEYFQEALARQQGTRLQLAHDVLRQDRKSTRLNSSHLVISYAVFCLKKKKKVIIVIIDKTDNSN